MSNFTQPAEDLSSRTKEYVDLRLDELKLAAAKGLSITASKLVGLLLITGVATNLVIVLSFGLILLVGELVGSYAWAAIGIALILGIAFWILIRKRDSLFRNTFVPVFVNLFFNDDDDEKRTEFLDIRTLEDLDAAIHRTRERIQAQGESVHDGLVEVRGFYTPRNIALQGVKRFAWEHNLFVIGLNAVRSLKNLLQK